MKIKAVFDTNIYISAIVFGGNPRLCLELAREGEIELYTSRAILLEIAGALRRKFQWNEEDIADVIIGISKLANVVVPKTRLNIIRADPSDNKILEAAKEAGVDVIVSGDKKHILPLKKFEGTKIISAAEFLKMG